MRNTVLKLVSLFSVLVLVSACKVEVEAKGTVVPQVASGDPLTCSAQLSSSMGGSVQSGVSAPIEVSATGGSAPYEILDSAVAFQSQTVIARTYSNTSNANIQVVDTVAVTDQAGHVTQCNFLVTVTPENAPPSSLACSLVATPSNPALNQNSVFVVTAQGGTAPYQFSNFVPGASSTVVSPLSATSATTASATAKYTTSGLRTASTTVSDNAGAQVTCSTSVNVAPAPSVSVVASPATSVVFGNTITLTATPANFSSTPTYNFTTSRSGVNIVKNGAVASVTSSTAQSTFTVTVTATAGSQTATTTIDLSFLNPTSLPCTLSHASGTYYPNDNVVFNVTATSGEALEITGFSTNSDATQVSSTASSRTIRYSTSGSKTVYATARSVSTGALCQAGATLSDSVTITPVSTALSCSGYTFYNPSYRFEWFKASAVISGGSGLKWVDTITITKDGSTYNNFDGQWIDSNSAWLAIYNAGTYVIKFNLKDTSGNTGSCTTTQVVWY